MQNTANSRLIPVVEAALLTAIPYADSLDGPIRLLSHEEFKQIFNCRYQEGMHINSCQLQNFLKSSNPEDDRVASEITGIISLLTWETLEFGVNERLRHPLENLVIRKFNPDSGIGFGLFLAPDSPIIRRGTVVALYGGEVIEVNEQNKERFVAYGTIGERGKVDQYIFKYTTQYIVSARDVGGIARFINHMPILSKQDLALCIKGHLLDPNYIKAILSYIHRHATSSNHDEGICFPKEMGDFLQQYYALLLRGDTCNAYSHFKNELSEVVQFIMQRYEFFHCSDDGNELDKLIFHAENDKHKVVTANLVKTPYIDANGRQFWVLVANRDIAAGEQLGYSYGDAAFTILGKFPRYFMSKGRELMSRTTYYLQGAAKVSFFNKVIDSAGNVREQALDVSFENLHKTLLTKHVIQARAINQCIPNVRETIVSTYAIRDQMCDSGVLPREYYGRLTCAIGVVTILRVRFPDVDIQAYYANPGRMEVARYGNGADIDAYKVNVVCKAESRRKYSDILMFFQQKPKCVAKMKIKHEIFQVVLEDVNEAGVNPAKDIPPVLAELCV